MVQLARTLLLPIKFGNNVDLAISFSGCGFLGSYHFGVLACLLRNGAGLKKRIKRCAGASAGALVAAVCVLAPEKSEDGMYRMYSLTEEVSTLRFGALTPGFRLHDKLTDIVEAFIPHDISAAQDNLYISLTRQKDSKNVLVSHFSSRKHLLDCLSASCYIPLYSMGFDYSAPRPMIDNEIYIDGGYTNNLPVFVDIPTITVSPFSGNAMVSPHDEPPFLSFLDRNFRFGAQEIKVSLLNLWRGRQALFPPSLLILRDYYGKGYKDMLDFLSKNSLIGAGRKIDSIV